MAPVRRLALTTVAAALALALVGCEPVDEQSGGQSKGKREPSTSRTSTTSRATVKINADDGTCWKGKVGHETKSGCGPATMKAGTSFGAYHVHMRKTKGRGSVTVILVIDGDAVDHAMINGDSGMVSLSYDD
ncbi:MAG TPA: hypothetical protein VFT31_03285 [Kribbella sp.]|nr:hypothetical protein [Kribbella sp.]